MTQEKQLLLRDLCARLPYGVIGSYSWKNREPYNRELTGCLFDELKSSWDSTEDSEFLPYLRPMSSMTEEEKEELRDTYDWVYSKYPFDDEDEDEGDLRNVEDVGGHYEPSAETYDWYNRKGFDYRGLIPKGLANSTEMFNPYKDKD